MCPDTWVTSALACLCTTNSNALWTPLQRSFVQAVAVLVGPPREAQSLLGRVIIMAGPESGAFGPSLYRDDTFRLSVKFSEGYPLEPPEVRGPPRWGASALMLCGLLRSPAAAVHASTLYGTKIFSKRVTQGIRQGQAWAEEGGEGGLQASRHFASSPAAVVGSGLAWLSGVLTGAGAVHPAQPGARAHLQQRAHLPGHPQ